MGGKNGARFCKGGLMGGKTGEVLGEKGGGFEGGGCEFGW